MIGFQTDTDLFPVGVVMVAGYQGKYFLSAGEPQGVKDIRATEGFVHYFGLHRAGIVMHDIIGAQQQRIGDRPRFSNKKAQVE